MNFTSILNYVSTNHGTIIAILVGALGLSASLEMLLTKFKVQSKKISFTLLHVMAAATGLVTLYLGNSSKAATGTYAGLALVAGFWHRFVVSDANKKYVTPFLTWLSNQNVAAPAVTSTTSNSAVSITGTPPGTVVSGASLAGVDAKPFTLDQPTPGK
jgi:hypothetical protein